MSLATRSSVTVDSSILAPSAPTKKRPATPLWPIPPGGRGARGSGAPPVRPLRLRHFRRGDLGSSRSAAAQPRELLRDPTSQLASAVDLLLRRRGAGPRRHRLAVLHADQA